MRLSLFLGLLLLSCEGCKLQPAVMSPPCCKTTPLLNRTWFCLHAARMTPLPTGPGTCDHMPVRGSTAAGSEKTTLTLRGHPGCRQLKIVEFSSCCENAKVVFCCLLMLGWRYLILWPKTNIPGHKKPPLTNRRQLYCTNLFMHSTFSFFFYYIRQVQVHNYLYFNFLLHLSRFIVWGRFHLLSLSKAIFPCTILHHVTPGTPRHTHQTHPNI